jgi:hypothetical protein
MQNMMMSEAVGLDDLAKSSEGGGLDVPATVPELGCEVLLMPCILLDVPGESLMSLTVWASPSTESRRCADGELREQNGRFEIE